MGEDDIVDVIRSIRQILPFIQESMMNTARMDERVATLKTSIEKMSDLVFVGDGRPSLMSQFSDLGQSIASLRSDIFSLEKGLNSLTGTVTKMEHDQEEMDKLHQSNRNARNIAILSSITSILVAIIGAAVLFVSKR